MFWVAQILGLYGGFWVTIVFGELGSLPILWVLCNIDSHEFGGFCGLVWLVWDLVGRVCLLLGSGRSVWVAWFSVLACGVVDCLCGFGWGFGLIDLGVGFGVLCVVCCFWCLLVFVLVLGAFVARQFCTWLLGFGVCLFG